MDELVIDRTGTVEKLAAALRGRILRGQLPPGTPLRESVLAARLGVSRNSMREAIRGLVPGRLVRHLPHRGFVVTQLQPPEVADIYRARIALEVAAIRERFDDARAVVADAEEILESLEARARERDWNGVVDADRRFHLVFVRLLRSERLARFFGELFDELRLALIQLDRHDGDPDELALEHRVLLDPIRNGDRRAAIRAFRDQLRAAARNLSARLAANSAADESRTERSA